MFRFTRKPSSGSHIQYLAKITHLVQSGFLEIVQDVSVMAAYCDLWGVCTVHSTHASQVTRGSRRIKVVLFYLVLTGIVVDEPYIQYCQWTAIN